MANQSGGIKSLNNSASLLLRDSHTASNVFGFNQLHFLAVPKSKFLFYVRFLRIGVNSNSTLGSLIPNVASDMTSGLNSSEQIGFILKSIELPKVSFDLEVLNQYNKKHIIQKRVEYRPINIKFHDTVDNKVFQMFKSYFKHYYADPLHSQTLDWSTNIIEPTFAGTAPGWGFLAGNLSADLTNYFSLMEIYQIYDGKYNQFNLLNPKIQSFDPGELDYGATGVTHEIAMTLMYEGINYVVDGAELASKPELIQLMGLDKANFYESEDGPFAPSTTRNPFDTNDNFSQPNNSFNSSLNQVASQLTSGQTVNAGGLLQGVLNSARGSQVSNIIGQLSRATPYNSSNTGTISPGVLSDNASPALRGLSIFNNPSPTIDSGADAVTGGLY